MKFTVHPPMRGGRVYGHDDDWPLEGTMPATCPICGRHADVFRRTLFGGLVCVSCAEKVGHTEDV